MKYKAIFCDFDGTLYSDDYTISNNDRQAIQKYVDDGGRFIISSGRLFSSILPHAKSLGLKDKVIVSQGANIYDMTTQSSIWSKSFEVEQAVEAAKYAEHFNNIVPMAYIDGDCYAKERNQYTDMFADICKIKIMYTGCDLSKYIADNSSPVTKILCIVNESFADEFTANGSKFFGDKFVFCKSQNFLVEIVKADVNKGQAVDFLCKIWNIDKSEIIAIGDSENDISMLQYAGLGIAVANAYPNVKAAADCVLDVDNNHSAVATIIERYCYDK